MDKQYLNWPFFEEHHRSLVHDLTYWCESNLREGFKQGENVRDECQTLVRKLSEAGWLKYLVTKPFGGVYERIDLRSICLIRETLASYSGLADFVFAMQGLGSSAILNYGNEQQKQAYLEDVASGRKVAAFAMTEASSGSDVADMRTSARVSGNDYVIDGAKTFISNGGMADFYVVFARTGGKPGAKGISTFIVDSSTKGIDDTEYIVTMAPHPLGTVKFDSCVVPSDSLLGNLGSGFRQGMEVLDMFRATVGAAALGFSRRALDEATQRSLSRTLFGASLASNPITQSRLAEMALDVDAAALLVYRAAWIFDAGRRSNAREASMAKLFATEEAQKVVDKALQLFGGTGVVSGVTVETLYREVRALRIYEGASEIQKLVIAKKHLQDYDRHTGE